MNRLGVSPGMTPLARLYDLNGYVLFLGATYATNTCFHLAEYRRPEPPRREFKIVREINGKRVLHEYSDVDTDSSVFQAIGDAYETEMHIAQGTIGCAECRLFPIREAVDFALAWLVKTPAGC
jgi:aminoglycoside 3-N-acetyltransferase